ncbi:MAG: YhcH/YjgK/YiaL family protein, partial [Bacteroides sp.]|nr:YhcH/YjgK/YiaL family protein [Bacteroides sp.]
MIIDSLTNGEHYFTLNPLFSKAFNYLNSVNLESLEVGRIELQADDLYVIVSDSSLKKQEKAKLEVHN